MGIPAKNVAGIGRMMISSILGILLVAALLVSLNGVSLGRVKDVSAEVVPGSWENMCPSRAAWLPAWVYRER